MTYREVIDCLINGISDEAMDIAVDCIEKRIPKKPIYKDNDGIRYTDSYICPTCGGAFSGTGIANFCYHCGQGIDWSEE